MGLSCWWRKFRQVFIQAGLSPLLLSTLHNSVSWTSALSSGFEYWWNTTRLDASAFVPNKDQRKAINRWNKYVLGQDYLYKAAQLCPQTREWGFYLSFLFLPSATELWFYEPVWRTSREKRRRRDRFDLNDSIHASEYGNVKKPFNVQTKIPIEPAHRFEVTLEPDSFTEEK